MRRHTAVVFIAFVLAGCGGASVAGTNGPPPVPRIAPITGELNSDERAAQVLNRLAFGPRPGEVAKVKAMGVERWIEQQLHPETIPDPTLDAVIASMPAMTQRAQALAQAHPPGAVYQQGIRREMGLANNAPLTMSHDDSLMVRKLDMEGNAIMTEAIATRLIRAQLSEKQLLEVMVDFWENHFSVYQQKVPSRFAMLEYDRDVIRPRALGRFRDLLGAVAHSTEMLFYLDNIQSQADSLHLTLAEWSPLWTATRRPPNQRRQGLNENYGRELLELHTLGVDGGYTQHDVTDAARVLTGWSLYSAQYGGGFVFRPEAHDAEPKTVLGQEFPGGHGQDEGERLLDILAAHPSTARYISLKLARRFVSDSPSTALVSRAAETFTRTGGDIREVVRTIVTSPEFFARANYRSKVKSPIELVVSTRRALDLGPDTTARTAGVAARLGQQLWGHLAPNGWPEVSSEWLNSGAMMQRIAFGTDVAGGRFPGVRMEDTPLWKRVNGTRVENQVDGVMAELLQGAPNDGTREALLGGRHTPSESLMNGDVMSLMPAALKDLVAMALGTPAFQKR